MDRVTYLNNLVIRTAEGSFAFNGPQAYIKAYQALLTGCDLDCFPPSRIHKQYMRLLSARGPNASLMSLSANVPTVRHRSSWLMNRCVKGIEMIECIEGLAKN